MRAASRRSENEGEDWFSPGFTEGTGALRIFAQPVPEPSTILLLLTGCAAAAAARGRRVGSGNSGRSMSDTLGGGAEA